MAQYRALWEESVKRPDKFWAREAGDLCWNKKWLKVLDWQEPFAKWFVGGRLNVAENCLDRHLGTARQNKAAIIWEGEPGERRVITYQQLHREVCLFANVLKRNKIKKGDRVLIYMPMIPEAAIAMLACARLGIVHSVVFGGFSAESIKDRVADCGAVAVITADGGKRGVSSIISLILHGRFQVSATILAVPFARIGSTGSHAPTGVARRSTRLRPSSACEFAPPALPCGDRLS